MTLDDLPPPSSASRKESQEKERSIYISLTSNTCAVHKYKGLMGRPVGMPCSSLLAALRIGEEWCINKSSLLSGVGGGIGRVACVGYFSLPPLKIYKKKGNLANVRFSFFLFFRPFRRRKWVLLAPLSDRRVSRCVRVSGRGGGSGRDRVKTDLP